MRMLGLLETVGILEIRKRIGSVRMLGLIDTVGRLELPSTVGPAGMLGLQWDCVNPGRTGNSASKRIVWNLGNSHVWLSSSLRIHLHKQPWAAFSWYSENVAVIHEFKRSGRSSVKVSCCSGGRVGHRQVANALSTTVDSIYFKDFYLHVCVRLIRMCSSPYAWTHCVITFPWIFFI